MKNQGGNFQLGLIGIFICVALVAINLVIPSSYQKEMGVGIVVVMFLISLYTAGELPRK